MIRIYCKNTGSTLEFPEGVSLLEVLGSFEFDKTYPILAAKVNNVLQGLKYRAFNSRDVEFLDYTTYSGRSVYCRSLCFVASKAVRDLFPEAKIKMRRPISKGYFCTVTKDGALTGEQIEDIRERMQEIIAADLPFRRIEARAEDAINVFRKTGDEDKVKLLETSSQVYINYHVLDKTPDYYYDANLRPGKHAFHEMGIYYIQEPSAMSAAGLLDAKPGETVLDLCAAPGGKATQIAASLQGKGLLVANEIHPARCKILSQNIERMGIGNALVTNEEPGALAAHFPVFFDKILVDAPCSGEGMFRKDIANARAWSLEKVRDCARIQKDIVRQAVSMLCPGGMMLYSTGTFAPEED